MQRSVSHFLQRDAFVVAGLWGVFQVLWYYKFGFVFELEATKYIEQADFLSTHGYFSQVRYVFYSTTIAVIVLAQAIKIGLPGALLLIMAVNLFAYQFFFASLRNFLGWRLPAYAAVLLLFVFWPFQSWSMFLFTECFFYSLVMVLFGHLLRFRKLTLKFLTGCLLLLCLLTLTRPLGILFVPPVLLFVFFYLTRKQKLFFLVAGLGFLLILNYVVQVVFTTTSDWNMTRALTEESLICDLPRGNATARLDLSHHPNQFYQLLHYVLHNFGHFSSLALTRMRYFFGATRTYYSFSHNAYLVVFLTLFYGSILVGWRRLARELTPAIRAFVLSTVACFAVTIALQCDDYHNRFFLTLTPLFVLTTVVVWRPAIERFFSKSRTG